MRDRARLDLVKPKSSTRARTRTRLESNFVFLFKKIIIIKKIKLIPIHKTIIKIVTDEERFPLKNTVDESPKVVTDFNGGLHH